MAKTKKKVIINTAQILEIAKLFEILGHDLRLSIILLIQEKQEANVTEIYTSLNLLQSVTSRHLAVLRKGNLVKYRKEKEMVFYSLNEKLFKQINKAIIELKE